MVISRKEDEEWDEEGNQRGSNVSVIFYFLLKTKY